MKREGLDLSKEVLKVSVGQRTAKPQAVKDADMKKSCHLSGVKSTELSPGSSPAWSDHPQRLADHNFAALWSTEAHSTSYKRFKPSLLQRLSLKDY